MKTLLRLITLSAVLVAALLPFNASVVSAHGHIEVGDYELVIGFINEPAYQGQPNGLDLRVTNTKTNEPVKGLEQTLKAEITFGGAKQELAIEPQWGQDGAYTANIVPTKAGAYTWRIFGDIETTPVDVSMTSGPEAFSEVEALGSVAFPAADPTAAELQQQIDQARTFGLAGTALGLIGVIAATAAFLSRRSTQSQPVAHTKRTA
jgi:hypothetical protein